MICHKALHRSARGVTADPGLILGCITTGRDWESHRAAIGRRTICPAPSELGEGLAGVGHHCK